jgi:hypothetical protein
MKLSDLLGIFFATFVLAFLTLSGIAAGDQFKDFGGFSLKVHHPDNHKNVAIEEKKTFKINGLEYLAINYYEIFPGEKDFAMLNVAVLKKVKAKYIALFEKNIDRGHPHYLESPFLFSTKGNQFIFFGIRGGAGHHVHLFVVNVLNEAARSIPLEDYFSSPLVKHLLHQGEYIYCRGPVYGFERGVMYGTVDIWKEGDGCCCPSTGEFLVFSYRFENGALKIADVKRLVDKKRLKDKTP